MQLTVNQIDAESVRKETEDGTEFLVAPIVLVRSMLLNGPAGQDDVYLPEREVENSVGRWQGVKGPIRHPTHQDRPISVHDDRADVPVIAEIRNPEVTDVENKTAIAGEVWIGVEDAKLAESEGRRIVNRLENGDAVEVSSGYGVSNIVSGEFDGEFRERAAVGIEPDHVALLPNEKGRCSISDGCGAGAPVAPAANALIWSTAADDPGTTHSSEETGEDAAPGRSMQNNDYSALGRTVAGLADLVGRGASPETDGSQAANEGANSGADASGQSTDSETGGAESPADSGSDSMGDKTQELVENHGFDAGNLPEEDTECFGRIYDTFANESEEDDETDTTSDDEQNSTGDSADAEYLTKDDAQDLVEGAVEKALASNQNQQRKSDLADEIAANTDRDRDDLEDLSVNALEVLADELPSQRAANFAAQRGAAPAPSTNSAEDFPALSANKRAEELGLDEEAE